MRTLKDWLPLAAVLIAASIALLYLLLPLIWPF